MRLGSPAPSRWLSLSPPWICCPCLHPGASQAGQPLCSCHLSQFPSVREGPEQMQSSRCEQPRVHTTAPRPSSVPLQHCVRVAGQKSLHRSPRHGPWSSLLSDNSSFIPIAVRAKPEGEVLGLSRSGLPARRWKAAAEEPLTSVLPRVLGMEWRPCLKEKASETGGVPLDC